MSLFVSCIPVYHHHHNETKWQKSPTAEKFIQMYSLVLACFCVYYGCFYSIENLLLVVWWISKPVVHLRSLKILLVTLFTM